MHGQFMCSARPEKSEKNRTRYVVGGDRINYPGEVATPTAEMMVAKLIFNRVISTKGARFMTMDISNFYLMTPLQRPEYIRVTHLRVIIGLTIIIDNRLSTSIHHDTTKFLDIPPSNTFT